MRRVGMAIMWSAARRNIGVDGDITVTTPCGRVTDPVSLSTFYDIVLSVLSLCIKLQFPLCFLANMSRVFP